MNRLVVVLLSVLIVLVAAHGFLVWRAADDARQAAETQECLQRSQTTAIIAVVAPALVAPAGDEEERTGRLQAIAALGEQADGC